MVDCAPHSAPSGSLGEEDLNIGEKKGLTPKSESAPLPFSPSECSVLGDSITLP